MTWVDGITPVLAEVLETFVPS